MIRARENSPPVISEANLTPLVDLALTLIVVFLIFMPMTVTTLLPVASGTSGTGASSPAAADEPPLLVLLEPEKIRVGGLAFQSEEALLPWLRDAFQARRNHRLLIKPLPAVRQQRLVRLLDVARRSGEWKTVLILPEAAPESDSERAYLPRGPATDREAGSE